MKRFRRAQPGRRERAYQAQWTRFARLEQTQDTFAQERSRWRRWQELSYIAFIIPIDDPDAITQIVEWQRVLAPWLYYDPQPPDKLHITLHYVGMLRRAPWLLPNMWRRSMLPQLAERVRPAVETFSEFDVQIGPLNAFSNVLFAEVRDSGNCIRLLRAKIRGMLPLRARPSAQWSFMPHVSLGYWGRQPAAPVIAALRPFREVEPVKLRVTRVKFTLYTTGALPFQRDLLTDAQEEMITGYRLKERLSHSR